MDRVTSKDGTSIAYDRHGSGPAVILVATGGASPESFVGGGGDFFGKAADAIAASIPQAERQTIEGQTHMVDPKALAPVLERFFSQ